MVCNSLRSDTRIEYLLWTDYSGSSDEFVGEEISEFNSAKQLGAPEGKIARRLPQFGPVPNLFCRE